MINKKKIIRTSIESHVYWKKHFHKNPLYFRIFADFQAYNEIDNFSLGIKQLKFLNQKLYVKVFIKNI